MECETIVLFALPQESAPFLRRIGARPRKIAGLNCWKSGDLAAAHTGIGSASVMRTLQRLEQETQPQRAIAAGFAGALSDALNPGDIVRETEIHSVERPVDSPEERLALFRQTGRSAVDMETETIRRWTENAGMEFRALRIISDTASRPIPIPFEVSYDIERQQPRSFAAALFLARHPAKILPLAGFILQMRRCSRILAVALERIL